MKRTTKGKGKAKVKSAAAPQVEQPPPAEQKAERAKPGEPPAQAGDTVETKVAEAKPQVLQSLEQGKKELDENPARSSALTDSGHLVREG